MLVGSDTPECHFQIGVNKNPDSDISQVLDCKTDEARHSPISKVLFVM